MTKQNPADHSDEYGASGGALGRRATDIAAIIADDEALARQRIVELLQRFPQIRVVAQCASGSTTVDAVRALGPDILFLDVQMPGLDGFQVLAKLRPEEMPIVIFSTAYDEYALAAFDVHAVDYLVKPFADARFDESLRRAEHAIHSRRAVELHERMRVLLDQMSPGRCNPDQQDDFVKRFAVKEGDTHIVIDAAAVDWIEAVRDYVRIHVGTRGYLLRVTMSALERRLDPTHFLRLHRSTIVQLDRICRLCSDMHGEYEAELRSGERVRVGRRYRDAALRRVGMHL